MAGAELTEWGAEVSESITRILVSIVGIPVVLGAIWGGGVFFALLVAVIATIAVLEFYRMSRSVQVHPQSFIGVAGVLLVVTMFLLGSDSMVLPVIILLLIMTLILEVFTLQEDPLTGTAVTILGVLYIGVFLGTLIAIRENSTLGSDQTRMIFIAAVFIGVWICDTAAYFFGIRFGRYRLFERVSPNKSVEGAVAGFLSTAVFYTGVYFSSLNPQLTVFSTLLVILIVGVFGQVGDLLESWLKRRAEVKDSSAILPGHGGVLDRFDSLILVAPLLYLAIQWNLI